ncbi:MAG: DMT family transporter [Alphaproteobacteria bacterium]
MNSKRPPAVVGLVSGKVSFGIICIILSAMVFAPMTQTATKFVAGDFPLMQVMFFRSLGQTIWMLLFFLPSHGMDVFKTKRPVLHFSRSTLMFLSSMLWVAAVATVPLATASAINFTAPIFVVLLSIPMLGERVGLHRWAAVLVGFVGALVIIQPGTSGLRIEFLLLLAAALLFALYQILTRKAAATESQATSSIYTVVVGLVVSGALVPWNYISPEPGDILVWAAFLAMGLLGGIRHYLVIRAYTYAPASVISPFFYGELIGVTLLGYLIFGDFPESTTWIGAAIIVASGLYIAHRERVRKP